MGGCWVILRECLTSVVEVVCGLLPVRLADVSLAQLVVRVKLLRGIMEGGLAERWGLGSVLVVVVVQAGWRVGSQQDGGVWRPRCSPFLCMAGGCGVGSVLVMPLVVYGSMEWCCHSCVVTVGCLGSRVQKMVWAWLACGVWVARSGSGRGGHTILRIGGAIITSVGRLPLMCGCPQRWVLLRYTSTMMGCVSCCVWLGYVSICWGQSDWCGRLHATTGNRAWGFVSTWARPQPPPEARKGRRDFLLVACPRGVLMFIG